MTVGRQFQCLATAADATDTSIIIRVQDDEGSILWIIFDRVGAQQQIVSDAAAQGISLAAVVCPAAPNMNAGDKFQCVATGADASAALVDVT